MYRAKQTPEEVEALRSKFQMIVTGIDVPRPVTQFNRAGFPDYILDEVKKAGFDTPTPIQMQGWPMALSGRDLVGAISSAFSLFFYSMICSY